MNKKIIISTLIYSLISIGFMITILLFRYDIKLLSLSELNYSYSLIPLFFLFGFFLIRINYKGDNELLIKKGIYITTIGIVVTAFSGALLLNFGETKILPATIAILFCLISSILVWRFSNERIHLNLFRVSIFLFFLSPILSNRLFKELPVDLLVKYNPFGGLIFTVINQL
jgi:hypothetical protein